MHPHGVEFGLERVHGAFELIRSGDGRRDEGLTANRLCGNWRSFERVNPALAGTNPMDTVFCEPVLARLPGKDGLSELIEIRTVRDGLSALNRCGMGGDHLASADWQLAAFTLLQAIRHPCQDRADQARAALLRLAGRSNSRLDS